MTLKENHFDLMFQILKWPKCTKSLQFFSRIFRGSYPDPHFVLSTMIGHSCHTYNYFIHRIIPIRPLNDDNDHKVHFESKRSPPPPPYKILVTGMCLTALYLVALYRAALYQDAYTRWFLVVFVFSYLLVSPIYLDRDNITNKAWWNSLKDVYD